MPEAKNVGPQMFDFKHFRNNANGSMVQKTATIAGALAVLSIVSAEVLSNMTQESDGEMRRMAQTTPSTKASAPSWLSFGKGGVDGTATATIPRFRKGNASACVNSAKIVTTYSTIGADGEVITTTTTAPKLSENPAGLPACAN